jgi:enoyl-CoA hydratase
MRGMTLVSYQLDGPVTTITMDDGKANALSPQMLVELFEAFDRAERDGVVVVLAGREGRFSGGFDLNVLRGGGPDALAMLRRGFELAVRLLSFPRPVLIACTGHAVAMASFLLLSADERIGAVGDFRITANEVAIGLTMPYAAVEICRYRLTPAQFNRAVLLSAVYSPEDAVTAGFLDRVVPAPGLLDEARGRAAELAKLDMTAHAGSKERVRGQALGAILAGIDEEFGAPA